MVLANVSIPAMIHSASLTPASVPSMPPNRAPNAMHEYVSV